MEFVPLSYFVAIAFFLGVIIGSFLNVYIYRFHTGKSLSGSSHCLSCQAPLRFYDLFPLLSYLVLRGRCRKCKAHIPSRYFWVELATGILFATVAYVTMNPLVWPLLFLLMAVLVVVAVYDLNHFVIPDVFVYTLTIVAVLFGIYQYYVLPSVLVLLGNFLAAILAFIFFAGLWWYSKGAWIGFGDAKLAIPLAFMVGLSGVFSMLVLSFWIGTIISLSIIGWQKYGGGQLRLRFGQAPLTIKSEVPFAPFLILGFLAVFLFGIDVLRFFSYAF